MKSVVLLFRKPVPHFFSIEKIFISVAEQLQAKLLITKSTMPHHTSSLVKILKNLAFARKQKGNLFHITGDVNYVALAFPGERTILTIHDCVFLHRHSGLKKWFFHRLFLKWPVRHSKMVTTISEQSKKEIIQFTNCPAEKIRVINNPVASAIYFEPRQFNQGKPRLLFLGSTPNKNLPRVIEAIKGLACSLHIVGIIPEQEEQKLRDYGIEYSEAVGLSEKELADTFAASDILLFPSLYEGFGLPILEGQKAGRPVLTSNQSPMKEVAGDGACLVDQNDVESIRHGLLRLINDVEYRETLIDKGFENVRRFEPESVSAQYLALYKEILEKVS